MGLRVCWNGVCGGEALNSETSSATTKTKHRTKPLLRAVFKGRREDLIGKVLCEPVDLSLDPNILAESWDTVLWFGNSGSTKERLTSLHQDDCCLTLSHKGRHSSAWQGSLGISLSNWPPPCFLSQHDS